MSSTHLYLNISNKSVKYVIFHNACNACVYTVWIGQFTAVYQTKYDIRFMIRVQKLKSSLLFSTHKVLEMEFINLGEAGWFLKWHAVISDFNDNRSTHAYDFSFSTSVIIILKMTYCFSVHSLITSYLSLLQGEMAFIFNFCAQRTVVPIRRTRPKNLIKWAVVVSATDEHSVSESLPSYDWFYV